MRKHFGKSALALAIGMAMTFAGQASAQFVVSDPSNLVVNKANARANTANMLVNTENAVANTISTGVLIHTKLLAKSIEKNTRGLKNTTNNIYNNDVKNNTVNKNFTWITNNYSDGDPVIIPIPGKANRKMASLDEEVVGDRIKSFRGAEYYQGNSDAGKMDTGADIAGSEMQKSSNDALVNLLSSQRSNIEGEAEAIKSQAIRATTEPTLGHAEQLQNAAALAGLQANQLVQMRALMIASQNQQAAAAQAAGDRQAREIASAQSLRRSFGSVANNGEQQSRLVKASW